MRKLLLFLLFCCWVLVAVLLVVLKLAGVVHWSWSTATAPIWLAWILAVCHGLYTYYKLRPRSDR